METSGFGSDQTNIWTIEDVGFLLKYAFEPGCYGTKMILGKTLCWSNSRPREGGDNLKKTLYFGAAGLEKLYSRFTGKILKSWSSL